MISLVIQSISRGPSVVFFICWCGIINPPVNCFLSAEFANWNQQEEAAGEQPETQSNPAAPRYGKPQTVIYEFGLKIISQGNASGIIGTVPVPVDWPEQKIELLAENKTPNLRNLTFKKIGKNVRQLVIKANRLSAGEIAEGTVVLKIHKRSVQQPQRPELLQLAEKVPSAVRGYLKPSPFIESNHKRIRDLSQEIEIGDEQNPWQQIESIYSWVRDNVEYKFDTQIHSCLDALDQGQGDCEELSSLFIAICRSRGIPARAVWIPSHTYPEFYLEDETGTGFWFPCQIAGEYEFGGMTEYRPILQKGDRFKLPGHPKPMRYVQPTLVAKDTDGQISIEFINRQITDKSEWQQNNDEPE